MGVVVEERSDRGARRKREGLKTLQTVVSEMRGIPDVTGIAFCAYQIAVMKGGPIGRDKILEQYKEYVPGGSDESFEKLLRRERLFGILCENDIGKKKYFSGWTESPMPLNLHGLLTLRAVSLLDQVNWRPDRV